MIYVGQPQDGQRRSASGTTLTLHTEQYSGSGGSLGSGLVGVVSGESVAVAICFGRTNPVTIKPIPSKPINPAIHSNDVWPDSLTIVIVNGVVPSPTRVPVSGVRNQISAIAVSSKIVPSAVMLFSLGKALRAKSVRSDNAGGNGAAAKRL